jgi:CPA2 family monovalent cation:H+ antiporter-2
VALLQFVTLGAFGAGAAVLLGYPRETAAYMALALTASSTLVVVKLLQGRRMLTEPVGRLVTGVLLLQDLLIVVSIPVVVRLGEGWSAIVEGVVGTLALVGLAGIVLRWIAPFALSRFAIREDSLILLGLSTLFGFLGVGHLLGLPPVAGAFLAGVSLSGFPTAALVRGQLSSIGDFFHPIFFVALGAILPVPTGDELARAAILSVVVVAITPPLVAFIAERAGFSARPAIASGLLLSQTSEFSLVVALQGLLLAQLDQGVFVVITLVTIATMILTPFLASDRVAWALVRLHPFKKNPKLTPRPEGHVLLLGCGRHGQRLLEELIVTRADVVVLDDDPALVERVREAGVIALRGDVTDLDLLREVGADRARIVISTVRRTEENEPLLGMAKGVPVLVRGFDLEDGEWIRRMGGRPILYSEAAARDFVEWYESEWSPGVASGVTATPRD